MKTKSITLGSLIVGGIILLLMAITATSFAQSGGTVSNGSSNTGGERPGDIIKLSPLRSDINVRPGESRKVTIYVQNLNTVPMTLKAINNDFIAGNKEDGTPDIILDENESAPTHSLKKFMEPISNIAINPGERKPVEVTINVPQTAQAGGYYGAVRFAPTLADGTESLSVSGSAASLIVLTVPGDLVENLTVKQFGITQKNKVATRFSTSKDLNMLLRLENKGNVQVAPFGDVFIQKGKKVIYTAKINDIDPKGLVLPDSVRKWEVPLKDLGSFGKYKVTAVVSYGGSNQTMTMEQTIWIIPTAFIVGAIAILLAIIVIVFLIVKSLKAYKQRILRGARRR